MLKHDALNSLSFVDGMESGKKRWWLVCNDGDQKNPRWFTKLLKRGYKHCWVLYYDGYAWYRLEKRYDCTDMYMIVVLDSLCISQYQNIVPYFQSLPLSTLFEIDRDSILLKRDNRLRTKFPFVLQNCSEFAKDYLGITSFSLTPWGLVKALTKQGYLIS